ncbi:hypothetical protein JCM4914_48950 [Streptomyces platensis subsp. malvinus]
MPEGVSGQGKGEALSQLSRLQPFVVPGYPLGFGGQLYVAVRHSIECLAVLKASPVLGETAPSALSREGQSLGEVVQYMPRRQFY